MALVPVTQGEQVASRLTDTVSDLIRRLAEAKMAKKTAEDLVKVAEERVGKIESLLTLRMQAEGVTQASCDVGSVSISESIVPHVEDWDAFHQFIFDNRLMHMLERRPSVLAFREMHQLGKTVPGVLPFVRNRVTFRET
jgi:hypothetical protein